MNRLLFFAKGMMVITLLGIVGSGAMFLFNSCTKNDDVARSTTRQKMLAQRWRETLQNTHVTMPQAKDRKMDVGIEPMVSSRAVIESGDSTTYGVNGDDIGSGPGFADTLTPAPGTYLLRENVDDQYTEEYILTIQNETRDIVEQSIEYIESYGFTEADFYEELGIGYDPALVVDIAIMLQIINEEQKIDYTNVDIFPFVNKAYAQGFKDWANCFMYGIIGIDESDFAMLSAEKAYEKVTRKQILRIAGKALTRKLGWFGAALTVADIAGCITSLYE